MKNLILFFLIVLTNLIVEDDLKGKVKLKSSKYDKDFPGDGGTTMQLLIPLENLSLIKN